MALNAFTTFAPGKAWASISLVVVWCWSSAAIWPSRSG
jgi:hypothetical protein